MELPIEFFLRMAWDPDGTPKEKIFDFTRRWAEREFGSEHASYFGPPPSSSQMRIANQSGWNRFVADGQTMFSRFGCRS